MNMTGQGRLPPAELVGCDVLLAIPATEEFGQKEQTMTFGIAEVQTFDALIAGVLILVMPWLLDHIISVYLIVSGLLGLGLIR